jgi:predicted aspartyl protease
MGLVHATVSIGQSRERLTDIRFLVDTGSFYSAVTPEVRDELGLPEGIPIQVMLADGRVVDRELTVALLKIDDREAGVPIEVVSVPEPLLRVSALEAVGMRVNPVTKQLEAVTPFTRPPMMKRYTVFERDP